MQHCDDDVLALVALGEQPSVADSTHLGSCARCRAEVESFSRAVTAGRGDRSPAPVVAPPPQVWVGIAAATGVGVRPRAERSAAGPGHLPPTSAAPPAPPAAPPAAPLAAPPASSTAAAPTAAVVPLRRREGRRFGALQLVAAAAAALVVGGALGATGSRLLTPEPPSPTTVVVAQTTLDPLPVDPQATGRAVVVSADGGRVLQVDVSKLAGTDGFYEVWLIDAAVKKMVPIGILTGTTGRFSLPPGLDLGRFPVVDISAEPLDGNPIHSGKSLLRGTISG